MAEIHTDKDFGKDAGFMILQIWRSSVNHFLFIVAAGDSRIKIVT